MRLKDKVAVITGGASGMGEASVYSFLREGASVLIADFNEETGNQTLEKANEFGRDRVAFIKTDVSVERDIVSTFEFAMARFGHLDVAFNNAGVGGAVGPLTETTVESWDYTMDVIAKGVFLGIKHAAKLMQKQMKAVIENEKLPDEKTKAKKKESSHHQTSKKFFDAYLFVFDSSSRDSFDHMQHLLKAIQESDNIREKN